MRSASPALTAFFQSVIDKTAPAVCWRCDLFTVTLTNGSVYRWHTFGTGAMTVSLWNASGILGPFTYTGFGPYVRRTSIDWGLGLDNKQMKVEVLADPTVLIGSIPVIQAIASDLFANATVRMDRLFMSTPGQPYLSAPGDATLLWFLGTVGDIEVGRQKATMQVDSELKKLNVMLPKRVYGSTCPFVLYDPATCAVVKSSFTDSGQISAGSSRFVFNTTLTPPLLPSPPSVGPVMSLQASNKNVNLGGVRVYFATFTYTSAAGETIASPETSFSSFVSSNDNGNTHQFTFTIPWPPAGGWPGAVPTGWNLYASLQPGQEVLQNAIPIPPPGGSSSFFIEPATGLIASGVPPPLGINQGYYAQGVITFALSGGGQNAGLSRGVKGNVGGVLTLTSAFPFTPATGDLFTISRGCDHTLDGCSTFGGLYRQRFGGTPFIPVPEQSL